MKDSVSILIPTHNRAAVLAQTLRSLTALAVPPAAADLEIVVVANACTDDTADRVEAARGELPCPVRLVDEPQANLNIARNRGVRESRGEIVALLDDDVWVEPHWLEGLLDVYHNHPADLAVGKVTLWWQAVERPPWFSRDLEGLLSCNALGERTQELFNAEQIIGANMSFRRQTWERLGGFTPGLDRTGKLLVGSGDVDFAQRALAAGLRMFYAPGAALRHWVAPHRVSIDYLSTVAAGNAQSRVFIKKRFDVRQALRSFSGHAYLVGAHAGGELLARLRGDEASRIRHRVRRSAGQGGLRGACRRLFGKPLTDAPGGSESNR